MNFVDKFIEELAVELAKLIGDAVTLILTLLAGHQILVWWEQRKKLREMDLVMATQFQQLFGEFKEIWRLWKEQKNSPTSELTTTKELFIRACSAEGGVEAIVLKLATDRTLDIEQILSLGLFRQVFQMLRKSISSNKPILYGRIGETWGNKVLGPDYELRWYHVFNNLSSKVSYTVTGQSASLWQAIIGGFHTKLCVAKTCRTFAEIHMIREEHWKDAVEGKELKATCNGNLYNIFFK